MRVRLKLVGFPDLRARLGGDEVELDLDGTTVGQLLEWLQQTHAGPAGTRLLTAEGGLDPEVQLFRNGREWIAPDRVDAALSEGDQITLLVLVAGG